MDGSTQVLAHSECAVASILSNRSIAEEADGAVVRSYGSVELATGHVAFVAHVQEYPLVHRYGVDRRVGIGANGDNEMVACINSCDEFRIATTMAQNGT